MILTLTPETEARLRSVATQRGLPPERTIDVLLAEAEADFTPIAMNEEETQQVLAALRKSEEDFAAGRWISLEDYEYEVEAKAKMLAELSASVEDHAAGRSMTIEEYWGQALIKRRKRN